MSKKSTPMIAFYEDNTARSFQPFANSRPWCEMRCGALKVSSRWSKVIGADKRCFLTDSRFKYYNELNAPEYFDDIIPAGSFVVNSRCAILLATMPDDCEIIRVGGKIAAVRLEREMNADLFADGSITLEVTAADYAGTGRQIDMDGYWINEVWDTIKYLEPLLLADLPQIERFSVHADKNPSYATRIGSETHSLIVEESVQISPFTVFDTSAGPIHIGSRTKIYPFTVITGPCYIGEDTTVSGGRISACSVGDHCKVNGELTASVLVAYSNKGHDGFVGHSVIGQWVNLGAGTTTSNLKNTYGTVSLWTPQGTRPTGLQFLGTLFGDYVKTGIGLRLNTGTVLGTGANIFDQMPGKNVPAFTWGSTEPFDKWDRDRFLISTERMMARRSVTLNPSMRNHLSLLFEAD